MRRTLQILGFEDDVEYMFTNIGSKDFGQMICPINEFDDLGIPKFFICGKFE